MDKSNSFYSGIRIAKAGAISEGKGLEFTLTIRQNSFFDFCVKEVLTKSGIDDKLVKLSEGDRQEQMDTPESGEKGNQKST